MTKIRSPLNFNDTASFEANLEIFSAYLDVLDPDLAAAMTPLLTDMSEAAIRREDVLDILRATLIAAKKKLGAPTAASTSAAD